MNIVVTGSSGRIGRAIHVRLSRQHRVAGFDSAPSSTSAWVGDLDDGALLARALQGADAVIHTAALHAPHVPHVSAARFRQVNVDGTRRVLDAAAAAGVRRIVFTSTTALYGSAASPGDTAAWVDETLPPQPQTIYHHTKLEAEALLREAAAQGGPSVRILRMSRCFPEPANLMAVFRLHRGIDARDVADAHAAALVHAGPAEATFVVSGATPFLREDCQALHREPQALLERRAPLLVEAFRQRRWRLPTRIDRVYSAQRAMQALDWRPRYGFEEVLAQYDQHVPEILPPGDGMPARE
ncbi:NAD(P)-dependent oxidoreductase [Xanthomonas sp. NCPPB 2654]|uniref:NAD-dependent epimerase/dehydratase family protein n=1 Tax=unclassified Xanthomonas TaxID=2643310 RepID=UPI0021DFB3CE|nr:MULTISPECIES: NAD(P)-dependent oxidoreductase [unclassified Xanthomonas]MDL5367244.1 NAD(P)-dependent oxidoreductase [Xanthomonas sp. NCPPB 2654]UYC18962.1 NAD(P)-dependent oxidoreductase [Xanthomonas sp. CFBP 8443]